MVFMKYKKCFATLAARPDAATRAGEIEEKVRLVTPTGFEPVITWMKTKCPGPLDDGASHNFKRIF